ncbi:EndoU domain-containing protein [Kitasatospora sp. NPDC002551]|uniref:EndoU domain-containing protein n=1 Tax=Kitasatospora sp. NPDC002551 TaxID=3154539 RepID=UPI00332A1B22
MFPRNWTSEDAVYAAEQAYLDALDRRNVVPLGGGRHRWTGEYAGVRIEGEVHGDRFPAFRPADDQPDTDPPLNAPHRPDPTTLTDDPQARRRAFGTFGQRAEDVVHYGDRQNLTGLHHRLDLSRSERSSALRAHGVEIVETGPRAHNGTYLTRVAFLDPTVAPNSPLADFRTRWRVRADDEGVRVMYPRRWSSTDLLTHVDEAHDSVPHELRVPLDDGRTYYWVGESDGVRIEGLSRDGAHLAHRPAGTQPAPPLNAWDDARVLHVERGADTDLDGRTVGLSRVLFDSGQLGLEITVRVDGDLAHRDREGDRAELRRQVDTFVRERVRATADADGLPEMLVTVRLDFGDGPRDAATPPADHEASPRPDDRMAVDLDDDVRSLLGPLADPYDPDGFQGTLYLLEESAPTRADVLRGHRDAEGTPDVPADLREPGPRRETEEHPAVVVTEDGHPRSRPLAEAVDERFSREGLDLDPRGLPEDESLPREWTAADARWAVTQFVDRHQVRPNENSVVFGDFRGVLLEVDIVDGMIHGYRGIGDQRDLPQLHAPQAPAGYAPAHTGGPGGPAVPHLAPPAADPLLTAVADASPELAAALLAHHDLPAGTPRPELLRLMAREVADYLRNTPPDHLPAEALTAFRPGAVPDPATARQLHGLSDALEAGDGTHDAGLGGALAPLLAHALHVRLEVTDRHGTVRQYGPDSELVVRVSEDDAQQHVTEDQDTDMASDRESSVAGTDHGDDLTMLVDLDESALASVTGAREVRAPVDAFQRSVSASFLRGYEARRGFLENGEPATEVVVRIHIRREPAEAGIEEGYGYDAQVEQFTDEQIGLVIDRAWEGVNLVYNTGHRLPDGSVLRVRPEFVDHSADVNHHVHIVDLFSRELHEDNETWSLESTPETLAHEIGHLIGFDDEYRRFQNRHVVENDATIMNSPHVEHGRVSSDQVAGIPSRRLDGVQNLAPRSLRELGAAIDEVFGTQPSRLTPTHRAPDGRPLPPRAAFDADARQTALYGDRRGQGGHLLPVAGADRRLPTGIVEQHANGVLHVEYEAAPRGRRRAVTVNTESAAGILDTTDTADRRRLFPRNWTEADAVYAAEQAYLHALAHDAVTPLWGGRHRWVGEYAGVRIEGEIRGDRFLSFRPSDTQPEPHEPHEPPMTPDSALTPDPPTTPDAPVPPPPTRPRREAVPWDGLSDLGPLPPRDPDLAHAPSRPWDLLRYGQRAQDIARYGDRQFLTGLHHEITPGSGVDAATWLRRRGVEVIERGPVHVNGTYRARVRFLDATVAPDAPLAEFRNHWREPDNSARTMFPREWNRRTVLDAVESAHASAFHKVRIDDRTYRWVGEAGGVRIEGLSRDGQHLAYRPTDVQPEGRTDGWDRHRIIATGDGRRIAAGDGFLQVRRVLFNSGQQGVDIVVPLHVSREGGITEQQVHAYTDQLNRSVRQQWAQGNRGGQPLLVNVTVIPVDRPEGAYRSLTARQAGETGLPTLLGGLLPGFGPNHEQGPPAQLFRHAGPVTTLSDRVMPTEGPNALREPGPRRQDEQIPASAPQYDVRRLWQEFTEDAWRDPRGSGLPREWSADDIRYAAGVVLDRAHRSGRLPENGVVDGTAGGVTVHVRREGGRIAEIWGEPGQENSRQHSTPADNGAPRLRNAVLPENEDGKHGGLPVLRSIAGAAPRELLVHALGEDGADRVAGDPDAAERALREEVERRFLDDPDLADEAYRFYLDWAGGQRRDTVDWESFRESLRDELATWREWGVHPARAQRHVQDVFLVLMASALDLRIVRSDTRADGPGEMVVFGPVNGRRLSIHHDEGTGNTGVHLQPRDESEGRKGKAKAKAAFVEPEAEDHLSMEELRRQVALIDAATSTAATGAGSSGTHPSVTSHRDGDLTTGRKDGDVEESTAGPLKPKAKSEIEEIVEERKEADEVKELPADPPPPPPPSPLLPPRAVDESGLLSGAHMVTSIGEPNGALVVKVAKLIEAKLPEGTANPQALARTLAEGVFSGSGLRAQVSALSRGEVLHIPVGTDAGHGTITVRGEVGNLAHRVGEKAKEKFEYEGGSDRVVSLGTVAGGRGRWGLGPQGRFDFFKLFRLQGSAGYQRDVTGWDGLTTRARLFSRSKTTETTLTFDGRLFLEVGYQAAGRRDDPALTGRLNREAENVTSTPIEVGIPQREARATADAPDAAHKPWPADFKEGIRTDRRLHLSHVMLDVHVSGEPRIRPAGPNPDGSTELTDLGVAGRRPVQRQVMAGVVDLMMQHDDVRQAFRGNSRKLSDQLVAEFGQRRLQQDFKGMTNGESVVLRLPDSDVVIEVKAASRRLELVADTKETEFNTGAGAIVTKLRRKVVSGLWQIQGAGRLGADDRNVGGGYGIRRGSDEIRISGRTLETAVTTKTKEPGSILDGQGYLEVVVRRGDTQVGDAVEVPIGFRSLMPKADLTVQMPPRRTTEEAGSTGPEGWERTFTTLPEATVIRDLGSVGKLRADLEKAGREYYGSLWPSIRDEVMQLATQPALASRLGAMTRGDEFVLTSFDRSKPGAFTDSALGRGLKVTVRATLEDTAFVRHSKDADLSRQNESSTFTSERRQSGKHDVKQGAVGFPVAGNPPSGSTELSHQKRVRVGTRDSEADKLYMNSKIRDAQNVHSGTVRLTLVLEGRGAPRPVEERLSTEFSVGSPKAAKTSGGEVVLPRNEISAASVVSFKELGDGKSGGGQVLADVRSALKSRFGPVGGVSRSLDRILAEELGPTTLQANISQLTRGGVLKVPVGGVGWSADVIVRARLNTAPKPVREVGGAEFEVGAQNRTGHGVSQDERSRVTGTLGVNATVAKNGVTVDYSYRRDTSTGIALETAGSTVNRAKNVSTAVVSETDVVFDVEIRGRTLGLIPGTTKLGPITMRTEVFTPRYDPVEPEDVRAVPDRVWLTHVLGSSDVVTNVFVPGGANTGSTAASRNASSSALDGNGSASPHPGGGSAASQPGGGSTSLHPQDSSVSSDRTGSSVAVDRMAVTERLDFAKAILGRSKETAEPGGKDLYSWLHGPGRSGLRHKLYDTLTPDHLQDRLKGMMNGRRLVVSDGDVTIRIGASVRNLTNTGTTATTEFNTGTQTEHTHSAADGATGGGKGSGHQLRVTGNVAGGNWYAGLAVAGATGHDIQETWANRAGSGNTTKVKLKSSVFTGEADLHFWVETKSALGGTKLAYYRRALGMETVIDFNETMPKAPAGDRPNPLNAFDSASAPRGNALRSLVDQAAGATTAKAPPDRVWTHGLVDTDVVRSVTMDEAARRQLTAGAEEFLGAKDWDRIRRTVDRMIDPVSLASKLTTPLTPPALPPRPTADGEAPVPTGRPGNSTFLIGPPDLSGDVRVEVRTRITELEFVRIDTASESNPTNTTSVADGTNAQRTLQISARATGGFKGDIGTFVSGRIGGYGDLGHQGRTDLSTGTAGQLVNNAKIKNETARYHGFAEVEVVYHKGDRTLARKELMAIQIDIPTAHTKAGQQVPGNGYLRFSENAAEGEILLHGRPPGAAGAVADALGLNASTTDHHARIALVGRAAGSLLPESLTAGTPRARQWLHGLGQVIDLARAGASGAPFDRIRDLLAGEELPRADRHRLQDVVDHVAAAHVLSEQQVRDRWDGPVTERQSDLVLHEPTEPDFRWTVRAGSSTYLNEVVTGLRTAFSEPAAQGAPRPLVEITLETAAEDARRHAKDLERTLRRLTRGLKQEVDVIVVTPDDPVTPPKPDAGKAPVRDQGQNPVPNPEESVRPPRTRGAARQFQIGSAPAGSNDTTVRRPGPQDLRETTVENVPPTRRRPRERFTPMETLHEVPESDLTPAGAGVKDGNDSSAQDLSRQRPTDVPEEVPEVIKASAPEDDSAATVNLPEQPQNRKDADDDFEESEESEEETLLGPVNRRGNRIPAAGPYPAFRPLGGDQGPFTPRDGDLGGVQETPGDLPDGEDVVVAPPVRPFGNPGGPVRPVRYVPAHDANDTERSLRHATPEEPPANLGHERVLSEDSMVTAPSLKGSIRREFSQEDGDEKPTHGRGPTDATFRTAQEYEGDSDLEGGYLSDTGSELSEDSWVDLGRPAPQAQGSDLYAQGANPPMVPSPPQPDRDLPPRPAGAEPPELVPIERDPEPEFLDLVLAVLNPTPPPDRRREA